MSLNESIKRSFVFAAGATMFIFGAGKLMGCYEEEPREVEYYRPYDKIRWDKMLHRSLDEVIYGDNVGANQTLMQEIKNFYYRDLGTTMCLSGLVHDIGGMAGAFVVGASQMKNKLAGLIASYTFAMIPEIYNTYQGNIISKDIFAETGKDAIVVLGGFALGRIANCVKKSKESYGRPKKLNEGPTEWWKS